MNYLPKDCQSDHYRIKQNIFHCQKGQEKFILQLIFQSYKMTRSHTVVPHDGSDTFHSGSFLITLAGAAS